MFDLQLSGKYVLFDFYRSLRLDSVKLGFGVIEGSFFSFYGGGPPGGGSSGFLSKSSVFGVFLGFFCICLGGIVL